MIREVRMDEYEQLMELYLHLHETSVPPAELLPARCGSAW